MKEKCWGAITEVDRGVIAMRSKWSELYHELRLRLERTDPSAALAIPFINRKLAKSAEGALRKAFARDLPFQVAMAVRWLWQYTTMGKVRSCMFAGHRKIISFLVHLFMADARLLRLLRIDVTSHQLQLDADGLL